MKILQKNQITERKNQNFAIDELIGIEESESLILYYGQTIWKILSICKPKATIHIGLVAVHLYKFFCLNTPIFKYDCKIAAIACVFLAAKLENGYQVYLRQLCKGIKGVNEESIKECEILILQGNDYELYIKTPWLPLLALHNDFEFSNDESYKEAVNYLKLTLRGDIIYVENPSKLATACYLAAIDNNQELLEHFTTYLEKKYILAKNSDIIDTSFAQWLKELNKIVAVMRKDVNFDNLKDINTRITDYRLEFNKNQLKNAKENEPRNTTTTLGNKRSIPSPQSGGNSKSRKH